MPTCSVSAADLVALLDGELTAAQRVVIEPHARECATCRERASALNEVGGLLTSQSVPVDERALITSINARLHGNSNGRIPNLAGSTIRNEESPELYPAMRRQHSTADLDAKAERRAVVKEALALVVVLVVVVVAAGLLVVAFGGDGNDDGEDALGNPAPGTVRSQRAELIVARDPNGGENYQLFLVNDDGLDPIKLTPGPAAGNSLSEQQPAWSPDGTQIAFVKDLDIYVMDATPGATPRNLTSSAEYDTNPVWSPDGKRILFFSGIGVANLFVMDANGSNLQQLTAPEPGGLGSAAEVRPAWSPDGTRIAFLDAHDNNLELWVMDADGTDARVLTDTETPVGYAQWSPDGSHIAFSEGGRVFVVDSDGSNQQLLTDESTTAFNPVWSPDGTRIAFVRRTADEGATIVVMRTNGQDQREVVSRAGSIGGLAWSPDGLQIAYLDHQPAQEGGSEPERFAADLRVVNADGSDDRLVLADVYGGWPPVWRPAAGPEPALPTAAIPPLVPVDHDCLMPSLVPEVPVVPQGATGGPAPIVLRLGDHEQDGALGPYCWAERTSDGGISSVASDPRVLGVPPESLVVAKEQSLEFDFSGIETPRDIDIVAYEYDELIGGGALVDGTFEPPCVAPDNLDGACEVRILNDIPGADRVTVDPLLPPGHYVIIVTTLREELGFTTQGFNVVIE